MVTGLLLLAFFHADGLRQARGRLFAGFLRLGYAAGFDANEGFVAIVRHIAREIADITIAADSLWELVRLRQLAMALMNRIQNNYRFVIGFNGALIGLGIVGILPPATSAMLHNLSTLGVSLHSMSALPVAGQATKVLKDL